MAIKEEAPFPTKETELVNNKNVTDSIKDYCIDCLFLPGDLDCKVKESGKITPVHITNRACNNFMRRVFYG